jgi:cell division protein ZapE
MAARPAGLEPATPCLEGRRSVRLSYGRWGRRDFRLSRRVSQYRSGIHTGWIVHRLPAVGASSVEEIVRGFVPTRRFAHVSFDSYHPDGRYPSQRAARQRLQAFAASIGQQRRADLLGRIMRRSPDAPRAARALYLDGGYGVGKTHLLAATYHAVVGERVYLSFGELAYTIARLGLEATLRAIQSTRLLCIDEFELDDVAQTRMAAMFLLRVLERRGTPISIVTTSNTLPSDLGRGRFAAEAFQREIGEIASAFEVVSIDGEDYRHRHWNDLARSDVLDSAELHQAYAEGRARAGARVLVDWPALASDLKGVHPVHYSQIATQLDALFIDALPPIDDQAVALRLVHFVDKLYDQEVQVAIATHAGLPLSEIFSPAYRHGGYEKKYRRCLSRLHELISETRALAQSTDAPWQRAR